GTNAPPVEPLFNRYVEMKPAEGAYIDFDTGREHRLPAGLDAADPKAMQAWIEKTGVDVRACVVTGWGVLTNLGLTVVELPEITYYTLSESLAALRGARAFPCEARLGPPPGTNWGDIPSTSSKHYAFRTREGAIGWLYVTRSQLKAPPIRYRVLERIAAEEAARLREPRSDASATFGPILERSVVIGTAGPVDGLDLASGKHVAAPPELSRDSAALSAWMGGDIIAVMAGESVGLKGLNIRLIPVASEAWDDLPATAVAELASSGPLWSSRLARTGSYWPKNYPTPLGHRPLSPEEARQYMWPDTFLFRNRIGAAGILQVVGSSSRPPGVTIRYKLAQDGKAR
ncbi:MAG: hypothetical protein NT154_13930, partial [Verrucomicrobia bacterium]|nr:hypothetical protein [Verrucomicrobiota bacterium]